MPTPEHPTSPARWQTLLAELKRRRVFRVAAVYGAVAFVVLQVTDILVPALRLPEGFTTGVALLAIVGFPLALVFAWAFQMTPEGVKRTDPARTDEIAAIVAEPGSSRWPAGLAALGGAILLVLGTWLVAGRVLSGGAGPPVAASSVAGSPGAATLPAGATAGAPAGGTVVAVLPFSVQGSPELGYLGPGMVSLLGTKLDGAGDLRSVDSRAVLQILERDGLAANDPEAGRRVSEAFGATLYVAGDIVQAGSRLQLSASLYAPGGPGGQFRRIGEASVDGSEDSMFDMVDVLAAQFLSGLSGGAAARVRRIAAVTTESLPALKAFLEGEEEFRRGQFAEAVASFQRAVAEDSTFALAHYRLSIAGEWNLQDRLSRRAAEAAVRHADRLAERDRRLLEAYLTRRRGDNLGAAEAYRSILGSYPDEMEAWLDLAEVQFHTFPLYGLSFSEARPTLERVIEFDPDHSTALIHLTRLAAYDREPERVRQLGERLLGLRPDPSRRLEIEAMMAVASGDPDRLTALEARLPAGDEVGVTLAAYSVAYAHDLAATERIVRSLTLPSRSAEAARLAYGQLADLAASRGRWKEARAELAALARRSAGVALEQEASLALTPLAPFTDDELAELAERLETLDPASVETSDNPSSSFTSHDAIHPAIRSYELGLLRARLGERAAALREAEALESMRLSPEAGSLGQDLAHSVRSEVHRVEGRLEEALAELEAMPMEVWYAYVFNSFIYAHPRERFVRAELLYALGRQDEAERWYRNLGEPVPPELPYLAAAQLRLAAIADSRGDGAAASAHRARVDALLADADPGLPLDRF